LVSRSKDPSQDLRRPLNRVFSNQLLLFRNFQEQSSQRAAGNICIEINVFRSENGLRRDRRQRVGCHPLVGGGNASARRGIFDDREKTLVQIRFAGPAEEIRRGRVVPPQNLFRVRKRHLRD
jgi:hypothetical protein